MESTSSVCAYPKSISSLEAFINLLRIDFSSTIFIYLSTFAVVGTLSGSSAKYSNHPTASSFPKDVNSDLTVIISIGSALLYKFKIDSYIVLLSCL